MQNLLSPPIKNYQIIFINPRPFKHIASPFGVSIIIAYPWNTAFKCEFVVQAIEQGLLKETSP